MNASWQTILNNTGAVFSGQQELLHFGDAHGALQAAASSTVVVPLMHLSLIEADGEDTQAFLHGQLTSDIKHLKTGDAQHAAWCSAKGRMLASFVVCQPTPEHYALLLSADLREAIQKRLQMFVLRAKVKLKTSEHLLVGLSGPSAANLVQQAGLAVPETLLTTTLSEDTLVLQLEAERFVLALPANKAQDFWALATKNAIPAGLEAWRWLDVKAAFPVISAATKEEFVPQMADFEKMGGVSFHKGCYPGQEIVARTQYLGKVKRHLYRVSCATALNAGDELHSPDNPDLSAGKLVSAAPALEGGFVGLAVIQAGLV